MKMPNPCFSGTTLRPSLHQSDGASWEPRAGDETAVRLELWWWPLKEDRVPYGSWPYAASGTGGVGGVNYNLWGSMVTMAVVGTERKGGLTRQTLPSEFRRHHRLYSPMPVLQFFRSSRSHSYVFNKSHFLLKSAGPVFCCLQLRTPRDTIINF